MAEIILKIRSNYYIIIIILNMYMIRYIIKFNAELDQK
jgi:hypothetical protein